MTAFPSAISDRLRGIVVNAPPPKWSPVPWGLTEIAVVIAANVEFALVLYVAASILGLLHSPNYGVVTGILVRMGYHLLGFGFMYWLVRRRGGGLATLGFRPVPRQYAYVTFLGFAGMVIILYGYSAVVGTLGIDVLEPQSNAPAGAFAGLVSGLLLVLRSVVVTPITEEALMRGFVFGCIRNMMPLPTAIVLSGVLFGIVHLSPGLMIPYALIGILFSYIYALTGSIYPCIFAHAAFNGISLVVASS